MTADIAHTIQATTRKLERQEAAALASEQLLVAIEAGGFNATALRAKLTRQRNAICETKDYLKALQSIANKTDTKKK